MKHVTYSEMAVELSKDWGKNAKDPESAVKDISVKTATDVAAIYLVALLEKIRSSKRRSPTPLGEAPEDAKRFPDAKVGDRLYSADASEGSITYVVIDKADDGLCQVVRAARREYEGAPARWSAPFMYGTLEEAWRAAARDEDAYGKKCRDRAATILKAVAEGRTDETEAELDSLDDDAGAKEGQG